ncbi:MAG: hypothetical protein HWN79_17500 [Candidatus Lokiarchaeota archaeon]|nr:hypothetical protein [Candidatus Lokiarchaeota archaeon]
MAKIKKKDKDKEKPKPKSKVPLDSLDNVLKSSKNTESTLHSMLKGVSEEEEFISSKEEKPKIAPQLSYETKKKIAEDYIMEEVPLTKRDPLNKRLPISVTSEEMETPSIETAEETTPTTAQTPSFSNKDNIYLKLSDFFEEVFESYVDRYNQWENSISSILSILRKMRKITKKNTEDLVSSIGNTYEKIQYNLEQFKLKRDQVEKIADVDIETMSGEFKKVLGLLELQVKEYQLKRLSDEYVHRHQTY